ncbi:hypothetical protein GCM10009846_24800 [Agrococcus versicolor]|uniref:Lipoprotein n=1 Tax=Agrococcus versicolor TaxID=501482 RepID=A0ABP5ML04_9MICO
MTRPASAIGAPAAVAVALLLLTGCAAGDAGSEASSSSAPSASPSPSASSSDEPAAVDTSDWLEYATHDGDMTYRYPADWTLESESELFEPDGSYSRWMDSATLTAPNGQTLLRSSDFVDIGGMCEGPSTGEVLGSEPIDVAPLVEGEGEDEQVIATVALDGDPMVLSIGITAAANLGDGELACPFYNVFGTSDGGVSMGTHLQVSNDDPLWNVDSVDDARAYMETDEYATILEILRSVRTS